MSNEMCCMKEGDFLRYRQCVRVATAAIVLLVLVLAVMVEMAELQHMLREMAGLLVANCLMDAFLSGWFVFELRVMKRRMTSQFAGVVA